MVGHTGKVNPQFKASPQRAEEHGTANQTDISALILISIPVSNEQWRTAILNTLLNKSLSVL